MNKIILLLLVFSFGCGPSVDQKDEMIRTEQDSLITIANAHDSIPNSGAKNKNEIYDKNIIAQSDVMTINDFVKKIGVADVMTQNYQLGDEFVTELYEKGTGMFVGFVGDTSKFDYHKLKYYKQSKRENLLMSKYDDYIVKKILKRQVFVGMTKEQARESWGKPDDINKTITQGGTSEQWIYGTSYLYFDDNRITTIQN